MDRPTKVIQTLAAQIAHNEVVKAELLAMIAEKDERIKELEEGEKDGDSTAT